MGSGWSWAALAAVAWGASSFLAGRACRVRGTLSVLVGTQVAGLLTMLVISCWQALASGPEVFRAWPAVLPWAATAGSAELLGFAALYRALSRGPMGIAAPVAGLGVVVPVLVGLSSGGGLTSWQVIGLLLAAAGIALLSMGEAGPGGRNLGCAVMAGLGFGIAMVALAGAAQLDEVAAGTVMRATTVPPLLLVWAWRRWRATPLSSTEPVAGGSRMWTGAVAIAAVAGACDALGNLTFALASTRAPLSVVALIGSLDPVVTALLARIYLAEQLHRAGRWGAVAAVVGAALTSATSPT